LVHHVTGRKVKFFVYFLRFSGLQLTGCFSISLLLLPFTCFLIRYSLPPDYLTLRSLFYAHRC
jgi:hypothetical protein